MMSESRSISEPSENGVSKEEYRRDVVGLLDRSDAEITKLRSLLGDLRPDNEPLRADFSDFARRLSRASEQLKLAILKVGADELLELFEQPLGREMPASKFRFLIFTALEVLSIEIRRIRIETSN